MTPSIGLLGLFTDVVILLALVAAVASRGAPQLARAMIATFAFTCTWLLTAVLDALRAPGWTMLTGGAVIVVSVVVITFTVHLWTQEGEVESGPGRRGNDGGGGPPHRRPDAPPRGGGGHDPGWWPEFERQVAVYVAECEREKQQRAVLPPEPAPYVTTRPDGPGGHNRGPTVVAARIHSSTPRT
jgi:hypothetical protein